MKEQNIVSKASFGVINGVKTLKIKGTAYEMGYQHGFLLAADIEVMIKETLLATTAYVAAQTGNTLEAAKALLWVGQKAAEPFIPEELLEEMKGITKGVNDAGITVSLDEILLWNTNYDQWCIYSHPHYWDPESKNPEGSLDRIVHGSGGCSSFSAWDECAGGDGEMIFCKDEDNFNMPGQLNRRIMVVADPDKGHGQMFLSYPGMIGLDGGFNEAGFEIMTQLSSMIDETMAGCGIGIFTRLILTHANTVDEAIKIFNDHPRCAGIAYHVADAKAKQAAVIETSSKHVCVRYPMKNIKALYQSNHSNCYPGWMGYSGYNMVADQAVVNEIADVSTVQAWQNSLRAPYNFYIQAPSRFERYGELIHQYYGNITHENAIAIMSDRYDPYTKMKRAKELPSMTNNVLCTICALYPDYTFHAEEPVGTFQAHIANMWSLVAYPKSGVFWLAINDFPAQYGGYMKFSLPALLGR